MNGTWKNSRTASKIKFTNHGYRRRRREASEGIDNLLNKIIAENFPNLEKYRGIHV
jgi:hypothetical protein